jgi:hypothetical protein
MDRMIIAGRDGRMLFCARIANQARYSNRSLRMSQYSRLPEQEKVLALESDALLWSK